MEDAADNKSKRAAMEGASVKESLILCWKATKLQGLMLAMSGSGQQHYAYYPDILILLVFQRNFPDSGAVGLFGHRRLAHEFDAVLAGAGQ